MRLLLIGALLLGLASKGQCQNLGINSSIAAGSNNIIQVGVRRSFIGAGDGNTNAANNSIVGAGYNNGVFSAPRSGIVAGSTNKILAGAVNSFIGAGSLNLIEARSTDSFIGAGYGNLIDSNSTHSFIGAGQANYIDSVSFYSAIVGGSGNTVEYGDGQVLVGGLSNSTAVSYSVLVGGSYNTNSGIYSFLGGGRENNAQGAGNTLVAGLRNRILLATESFLGGGEGNHIGTNTIISYSTLSGGRSNQARASFSVISGGEANVVTGSYGAIAGGYGCQATNYAFAAGMRSKATNTGSFVWCGQDGLDTTSTNNNSFTVRCQGGARFLTTSAQTPAALVGVTLAGGATAWAVLSDSNAKTGFQPIRQREVLSKVAALPVRAWEYKHDPGRRYLGPTSQDFRASFGLGNDTSINTLDADGVLFASVQGLVQELEERDRTAAWRELQHASALAERDGDIESLKKDIRELKNRIDSMLPPSTVKK